MQQRSPSRGYPTLEGSTLGAPGQSFDLEDVISHLPGRDASLSRVYASGVPMQATANRRGDDLTVTITWCQQT